MTPMDPPWKSHQDTEADRECTRKLDQEDREVTAQIDQELNPLDYNEHLLVARHELVGKDNYGETITDADFEAACHEASSTIVEAGNQVVVVTPLDFGGREVDTIIVIGLYIPHDGQCTTVINHCDECRTFDNADEMFPDATP